LSDVLDDNLRSAAEKLRDNGIETLALRADVSDISDCKALVHAAVEKFGKVDMLVNNAGISIVADFEECSPEACRKLVDINVLGTINMTSAALDQLKKSRGHLIFVSSVSGLRAIPTGSIYSASKSFIRSFGESLRLELKPYGVHVGVIIPGFTTADPSKTVMRGDGSSRPIDRPAHDTPKGVAKGIAKLIEYRERERVLTPLGKMTAIMHQPVAARYTFTKL
jgi:short-subunit dehydrogenase